MEFTDIIHKFYHPEISDDEEYYLIVLNTSFNSTLFKFFWSICKKHILADGGSNRLFDSSMRETYIPDAVVGDFDSARPDVLEYYKNIGVDVFHDPNQDNTDTDKCFEYIYSHEGTNSSNISAVVLGDLGGRMDHAFNVINSVYSHQSLFNSIILQGEQTYLEVLLGGNYKIHINKNIEGHFCGIVPFSEPIQHLTTKGLKWDLTDFNMHYGGLISTSNEVIEEIVEIQTPSPFLWIVAVNTDALKQL
ncbi:hypothetical protein WA158_001755 [Blastocystis sp. Blastoise]